MLVRRSSGKYGRRGGERGRQCHIRHLQCFNSSATISSIYINEEKKAESSHTKARILVLISNIGKHLNMPVDFLDALL
ncbi:hypothetical protein QYM36_005181, partial [Artemia franciscana]